MPSYRVLPNVEGAAVATMHELYHELDPDPDTRHPEISCILCKTRHPLWETLTGGWSIVIIDARIAFVCGKHWPVDKSEWLVRFTHLLPQIRAELQNTPRAYDAKLGKTVA